MNSNAFASSGAGLNPSKLPSHVAIIMDGNGRWAKKRLLNRIHGHEKGAETVRTIVRTCRRLGIPFLTLYAFSTENWARPKTEVAALMHLLQRFLESEQRELAENDIRLNTIGETGRLPADVAATLDRIRKATASNRSMTLTLALSYGSRSELTAMARHVAEACVQGRLRPEDITEATVSQNLFTAGMPDPDLLIRTSGEYRISNFLLWQIAYTEIAVTDTLWPDFSEEEFVAILQAYGLRERRFGGVPARS